MANRLEHCGPLGINTLIDTISTLNHPFLYALEREFFTVFGIPASCLTMSFSIIALRSIGPYCIADSWSNTFLGVWIKAWEVVWSSDNVVFQMIDVSIPVLSDSGLASV